MNQTIVNHSNVDLDNEDKSGIVFYSTFFCPFAQRTWMALERRKINYKWIETTLYHGKPSSKKALSIEEKRSTNGDAFIAASPRGLVPAIIHNGYYLNDSLALLEYINEAYATQGDSLLPSDPAERCKIRMGINLFNEVVIRRFYSLLMSSDTIEREMIGNQLKEGFADISKHFDSSSPFFSSFGFSMFECACLPWYQRMLNVLKVYRHFTLDSSNNQHFQRLDDWYNACLQVEAFSNTLIDDDVLIDNYTGYADGTATSNVAQLTKK